MHENYMNTIQSLSIVSFTLIQHALGMIWLNYFFGPYDIFASFPSYVLLILAQTQPNNLTVHIILPKPCLQKELFLFQFLLEPKNGDE